MTITSHHRRRSPRPSAACSVPWRGSPFRRALQWDWPCTSAPPGKGDCQSRVLRLTILSMGHLIDRCDFIDMLEESVTTGGKVAVSLHDGQHFVDQVNDVVTQEGQDWAVFQEH